MTGPAASNQAGDSPPGRACVLSVLLNELDELLAASQAQQATVDTLHARVQATIDALHDQLENGRSRPGPLPRDP